MGNCEKLEEGLAKGVEIKEGVEVIKEETPKPIRSFEAEMFTFKYEKETSIFGPLYGTD